VNNDIYGLRQADLTGGKGVTPTQTSVSPDMDTWSFYKSQYDAFAGNPTMQNKIVAAFYEENSPEKKRQKEQQQMFQQALMQAMGGGSGAGMSELDMVLASANPGVATLGGVPAFGATSTSTNAPVEEEGTFGFGTGKGNLFGEGGLVSSLTQPFRQGLIDPVASLIQSGGKIAGDVLSGKPLGSLTNVSVADEARQLTSLLEKGQISKVQYDAGIESLRNKIQPGTQDTALGSSANAVQNQQAFGVTQQEHNDYMSNPGLGGVKSAVGIGSYAIPAGLGKVLTPATSVLGKAGQAALTSGLSSGAFGFGTSRPGEEIDRTLESAGTGAVIGGGLNLLGQGANAVKNKLASGRPTTSQLPGLEKGMGPKENLLTKTGEKIEASGLGAKAKGTPTGALDAEKLKSEGVKILREEGQRLNMKGVGKAYNSLRAQFDEVAKNIKEPISTTNAYNSFIDKLDEAGFAIDDKGVEYAIKQFNALGKTPSVSEVTALIGKLQGQLGSAYKAIETGSRTLTASESSRLALAQSLRDTIGNEVPKLNPLYSRMSTLHQLATDTAPIYNKSGQLSLPLLLGGLKVPTGGVGGLVSEGAGKLLQKAGNISLPAIKAPNLSGVNNAIPSFIGPVASTLSKTQMPLSAPIPAKKTKDSTSNTNNTSNNTGGVEQTQLKNLLLMGLLNENIDATTYNAIVGSMGGAKATAKQQNDITAMQIADQRLARIEKMITDNPDYFSPTNLLGRARDTLGGIAADPVREGIKAQLQEQLRNMVYELSGTAASDKERENIEAQLPAATDTVETSLQKLGVLKATLEDRKFVYRNMGLID
jgi:hypothetical protein